ncbi:MAG: hypothetical protein CME06_15365 [Gemmatimonadetes bacterium]|nr:hypothetical protein [Gemmatimonadota bacterium]
MALQDITSVSASSGAQQQSLLFGPHEALETPSEALDDGTGHRALENRHFHPPGEIVKLAGKTVYSMAQQGWIPAFKVRGQWRIRRSELDRWIDAQQRSRGEDGDGEG